MTSVMKTRFKAKVAKGIRQTCVDMSNRCGHSVEDLEKIAYTSLLKHPVAQEALDKTVEKRLSPYRPMEESIRQMWTFFNESKVVATNCGFKARRMLLSCVASPNVTFKNAKRKLGGRIKKLSFRNAKRRRLEALREGDAELL